MNIKNCKRCKKIYKYDGFNLCHTCRQEDEADFQIVKEYLYENPGANVASVVKDTEVETEKVMEFLREGRLEIRGGGDIILDCEKCGVEISSGRFCGKCTKELQDEIGQAIGSREEEKGEKPRRSSGEFRIADRHRK